MIHTTIGVYLSGDYKVNGVKSENLKNHIEYNKTARFGRALLVDGKVVYRGSYKEEDIPLLEERFKDIKVYKDTAPYH
jgi:hypothetical protein